MNSFFMLATCKENKQYVVSHLDKNMPIKTMQRLALYGFLPNEKIILTKKSTLKKTFLISVNNLVVSIRSDIASFIFVKK